MIPCSWRCPRALRLNLALGRCPIMFNGGRNGDTQTDLAWHALCRWLCDRQGCFCDEAVNFGLPSPRGVLMLGVQGAGKSLAAKAVATAWQRPLLRMDVGALYDKFIGESEHRLRDALRQAGVVQIARQAEARIEGIREW